MWITSPQSPRSRRRTISPPDVFVFAEGAFERVEVPRALGVVTSSPPVRIEKLGERTLLLANNVVPLERVAGKWQRSQLFAGIDGLRVSGVSASASGKRICGLATRLDASGRDVEGSLWTIDSDGNVHSITIGSVSETPECMFSPDDERVAFGRIDFVFDSTTFERIAPPSYALTGLLWATGDALYGQNLDGGEHVLRIDWSTLVAREVPELTMLPARCPAGSAPGLSLYLPRDDCDVAFVKLGCGCIDCDLSATLAWRRSTGARRRSRTRWNTTCTTGMAATAAAQS